MRSYQILGKRSILLRRRGSLLRWGCYWINFGGIKRLRLGLWCRILRGLIYWRDFSVERRLELPGQMGKVCVRLKLGHPVVDQMSNSSSVGKPDSEHLWYGSHVR